MTETAENSDQAPMVSSRETQVFWNFGTLLGVLAAWAFCGVLAYPPLGFWPASLLGAGLLGAVAEKAARGKKTLGIIYLVMAVWWAGMFWWLYPVTVAGTLMLAAYCAAWGWALIPLLRLLRRWHVPLSLGLVLVWTSLEYLRGEIFFGGFPWFLLGSAQPVQFIQIADLGGVYGVSFVTALTVGLGLEVFLLKPGEWLKPPARWKMKAVMVIWAVVWAYGFWRIQETDRMIDKARSIRVAVIQTDIPQSNKDSPSREQQAENLRRLLALATRASELSPQPDLLVLPETMVSRPLNDEAVEGVMDSAEYRRQIEKTVAETGIPMVVGAHAMEGIRPDEQGYATAQIRANSAYFFVPPGRLAARYDKIHRVPFGEYLPLVDTVPALKNLMLKLTPYQRDYSLTPGSGPVIFEIPGSTPSAIWRLATPICFEDLLGRVPRMMVWGSSGKQVDLMLNLSNEGWYTGLSAGLQHEQMARFRCIENRLSMARAVNLGASGLLDSAGRLVSPDRSRAPVGREEQIFSTKLHADTRNTLYGQLGDWPGWGSLLGLAAVGLAGFRRNKKERVT